MPVLRFSMYSWLYQCKACVNLRTPVNRTYLIVVNYHILSELQESSFMNKHLASNLVCISIVAALSGCGSSGGSDTQYTESYLQFYNGSSSSAVTYMRDDEGTELGSVAFADATSLYSLESGSLDLEFYRIDADDKEVIIANTTVELSDGDKTLVVLSGDYEAAEFNQYQFEREEMDEHFRLFAVNLSLASSSYDLYMGKAGEPFEAANFLGNMNYTSFEEMVYWDGDSDSDDFDQGDYTLYLTNAGEEEVIFESATIGFDYATEYTLAIRDTGGVIEGELEIDIIINSSTVTHYADDDASSQFRVYNSLNDEGVAVLLEGNDDISFNTELAVNGLSEFERIEYGDYRLSSNQLESTDKSFNNRLVTLNQGESKAIIIYEEEDGSLTSMSFDESSLPQIYDKQLQGVNLVPDFIDLDLYLVRKGETIETAEYKITSIDFGENKTLTVPSDYYELIAVYDNSDDTQVLLDRTELLGLTEEENYIITIEPDSETSTGYKISLLK